VAGMRKSLEAELSEDPCRPNQRYTIRDGCDRGEPAQARQELRRAIPRDAKLFEQTPGKHQRQAGGGIFLRPNGQGVRTALDLVVIDDQQVDAELTKPPQEIRKFSLILSDFCLKRPHRHAPQEVQIVQQIHRCPLVSGTLLAHSIGVNPSVETIWNWHTCRSLDFATQTASSPPEWTSVGLSPLWRRASIFCKAPLKKSASSVCRRPGASNDQFVAAAHVRVSSPVAHRRPRSAPTDPATCRAGAGERPTPPTAQRCSRSCQQAHVQARALG